MLYGRHAFGGSPRVRLVAAQQGHCWVRFHPAGAGELIGRCELIARAPFFAFYAELPHKPKHRKAWWKR